MEIILNQFPVSWVAFFLCAADNCRVSSYTKTSRFGFKKSNRKSSCLDSSLLAAAGDCYYSYLVIKKFKHFVV
ncbi:hypothetical protein BY996DRAFT_2684382 [Phakopsora pachyrhizi]|nr:hypothetical protein BY996DRAFT_2684382 [Phakopsora pachyrhizi]